MADRLTREQRHRCMSRIRSKDTKPEMRIRRALFSRGFRYRVAVKALPGTPDIVLAKYRTVIFVNGCFWHGHQGCRYYVLPKTNTEFWQSKILRNRERDGIVYGRLEALGWRVVTLWECELSASRIEETTESVVRELLKAKKDWEEYKLSRKQQREKDSQKRQAQRQRQLVTRTKIEAIHHIPQSVRKLSQDED